MVRLFSKRQIDAVHVSPDPFVWVGRIDRITHLVGVVLQGHQGVDVQDLRSPIGVPGSDKAQHLWKERKLNMTEHLSMFLAMVFLCFWYFLVCLSVFCLQSETGGNNGDAVTPGPQDAMPGPGVEVVNLQGHGEALDVKVTNDQHVISSYIM